jgi:Flp pilus assembly pilin Flp/uncharacterized membrane protein YgcG
MKFMRGNRGATVPEYIILLALISLFAIPAILLFQNWISDTFEEAAADPTAIEETTPKPAPNRPAPTLPEIPGDTPITIGTRVDPKVPADTEPGDLLVAFVTHRSAMTQPSGWDFIASQKTGSYGQWLTVYAKRYEATDGGSIPFRQTSSGRMLAHIATVKGADSTLIGYTSSSGTTADHSSPGYVLSDANVLVLAGRSEALGATSGPTTITVPSPWTLLTPPTVLDNRMGVAWRTHDTPNVEHPGVDFTDSGVSSHDWASIVVFVKGLEGRVTLPPPGDPATGTPTIDPIEKVAPTPGSTKTPTYVFFFDGDGVTSGFNNGSVGGGTGNGTGGGSSGTGGSGGSVKYRWNRILFCPPSAWHWDPLTDSYHVPGVVTYHGFRDHTHMPDFEDAVAIVPVPNKYEIDYYGNNVGKYLVIWYKWMFTQHYGIGEFGPPPSKCY